ncbi:MAG: SGNH/GDSL hydrolase family protein [Nitrospira sp.]|nr:SGNH/GDSL hydrolase family protein [Nitrospira sp.]
MKRGMLLFGGGLLCLLTALVLYEIVLRVFFAPPQLVAIRKLSSPAAEPKRSGSYVLETETGRRLQPNMRVEFSPHPTSGLAVTVETNSLGYRNRELAAKSVKRILFLGDSITFSEYLQDADTFVRQVETLSVGRTEPLETVNAGIFGESAQTYAAVLKETGLSIKPDLVVIGLYLNDFAPSRYLKLFHPPEFLHESWAANYLFHIFSKKYAKLTRPSEQWYENIKVNPIELQEWSDHIACCFSEMEGAGAAPSEFMNLAIERIDDWGGAWSEGAWDRMGKTLVEMQVTLDRAHVPMAIVLFPVSYQVENARLFDFPQRKAAALAKKMGVPLLDMLPLLREERSRSRERFFYDQCHLTPYASRVVAEHILGFFVERNLVASVRDAKNVN